MKILERITLVCLFFLFQIEAWASPNVLTYQGRILQTNGTPLEYSNVSFLFEIASPNGGCVIYREQHDGVNMINSGGIFDVPIGSGTKLYPADPLYALLTSFSNSQTHVCDGGSIYSPLEGDGRILKVQFHDGNGWKIISPSNEIRTVPYAGFAFSSQKLGTKTENDFVIKTGIPSCSSNQFLNWNGTALVCASITGGSGAGTVVMGDDPRLSDARTPTGSAGGDLSGTYPSPSVVKIQNTTVSNATPTPGQVLKYDGLKWAPSAATLNLSSEVTGTLPIGNGGTGVVALASNKLVASNATGNALTTFDCGIGQVVSFDATGTMICSTFTTGSVFLNGGNNFFGNASIGLNDNYDLDIKTAGSPRITILATGNVGIGAPTPSEKLEVMGNIKATNFISTSDVRLKRNITSAPGLDLILKLNAVQYDWHHTDGHDFGFIAQEIEKIRPDLVVTNYTTGLKAVKYQNIISPLVHATQQIHSRCEQTQADIIRLKEENRQLKDDNEKLKSRLELIERKLGLAE